MCAKQVIPLLADLRQSAIDFAGALVAYAAGLEAQVCLKSGGSLQRPHAVRIQEMSARVRRVHSRTAVRVRAQICEDSGHDSYLLCVCIWAGSECSPRGALVFANSQQPNC